MAVVSFVPSLLGLLEGSFVVNGVDGTLLPPVLALVVEVVLLAVTIRVVKRSVVLSAPFVVPAVLADAVVP